MFITIAVVSIALAILLVLSALIKLTRREPFVQGYLRVGVPEDKLTYLAYLLLAAAAVVIAGLWWAPLGIAAAIGVICYFLVAVIAHLRAHDAKYLPTPLVYLLVAALVLTLHLASR